MGRAKKPNPMEAFEDNIADAERILAYSRAMGNKRVRAMRKELRDRIGEALRYTRKQRLELDCIESDDLFVVFRPGSQLRRQDFEDRRPLRRQAIVAGCAALETYVADKAIQHVMNAIRSENPSKRLREIPLTVGHWLEIEEYTKRGWGIKSILKEHIREVSSTSPNKVGEILSTIGISGWAVKVDTARKSRRGTTVRELTEISERRNRIAHTGDRSGQGRASLDADEVANYLEILRAVARAIEEVVNDEFA